MPALESEIELIEAFSKSPVIGLTINHENMTDEEIVQTISDYEEKFGLPATDVLKYGCEKLITKILNVFPELSGKITELHAKI
jgi:uncharacterized NAD-dependent epimerase/dehydratase family protein